MKKIPGIVIIVLILTLGFALRFYKLDSIPAGLHADAASQGYNAFSILSTGKDFFGQSFPILFRTFGYYQPPLYTYLTIVPIALFGNSQLSAHFISALSGFILVFITFLFILILFNENRGKSVLALISALIIAIAPWSVFFSRLAIEANLGLLLFVFSLFLFIYSLRKIQILPLATIFLGISTHAYYSERLIAVTFLPIFLFLFRKVFLVNKAWIILSVLLFIITLIPHLLILNSGAFSQRFNQVSSFGSNNQSRVLNISKTILNNYLIYYSPRNLFFDSDINLGRTMPGLSVFYNWLLIPFLIGIWYLLKNKSKQISRIFCLLLLITPLPATFTGDVFYPLRILDFLWVITLVTSLGLYQIYIFQKSNRIRVFVLLTLLFYSLFSLYNSYFILFKYEKAADYGYAYMKLVDKLSEYRDKQIIIDLARDLGVGIRMAYLKHYPPSQMQNQLSHQLETPYYSSIVNTDEIYQIDNVIIKPLNFSVACQDNTILVGDRLAVSGKQAQEHTLKLEFEIKDLSGDVALLGYSTHPTAKCKN